jgi:hypothetical protein
MHEDTDLNRIGVGAQLTPEEIAEFMKTPEGALELQRILADLKAASPTGGALGQISDLELEQFKAASPTGGALGQISDLELEQFRAASPTGGALGQIGASPNIPGATRGLPLETIGASPNIPGATIGPRSPPLETIGASPDIPGATRGLPPSVSGMNPVEENRRRMMQQLIPTRGLGLRY